MPSLQQFDCVESNAAMRFRPWYRYAALLMAMCLLLPGCIGYHLGNQSLYTPQVRTVHVPVFQSDSFRRNLGERLTEAVIKEIELKTPYKVVPRERADTVLSGRLVGESKDVIVESRFDDPRNYDIQMSVLVNWTNRAGEPIHQSQTLMVPDQVWEVSATSALTPEVGQSLTVAQQQAIQRLAEQIVSMMEAPWYTAEHEHPVIDFSGQAIPEPGYPVGIENARTYPAGGPSAHGYR